MADNDGCRLLGVTRQLVGESWLHAAQFRYAGSIGPRTLTASERTAWSRLGSAVMDFAGLRGLFGIDAIVRHGVPYPVEVNPRYSASVEVLEYATGVRAVALHRKAFDATAPPISPGRENGFVGKAIWFAPQPVRVPAVGPWDAELRRQPEFDTLPAFGDIPRAGQRIAAGQPMMTVFATAATEAECEQNLRTAAAELDALMLR